MHRILFTLEACSENSSMFFHNFEKYHTKHILHILKIFVINIFIQQGNKLTKRDRKEPRH